MNEIIEEANTTRDENKNMHVVGAEWTLPGPALATLVN